MSQDLRRDLAIASEAIFTAEKNFEYGDEFRRRLYALRVELGNIAASVQGAEARGELRLVDPAIERRRAPRND